MIIVGATLMAEQNLSTLAPVLSSRPTHHLTSFHLHLTHPTSTHLHSILYHHHSTAYTILQVHNPNQMSAKGTSLTEAPTVDRHASSAKFLSSPLSPIPKVRNVYEESSKSKRKTSNHDRSDHDHDPIVRPTVPTDRPNAAVDPKPFLKPNPPNSSPSFACFYFVLACYSF
ncbi:unnamed protein product [Microthlaspi erraticum]|uniref:Uncharacterized protein n=1 Tax=Microthlaspi erraticum TaxID=1685480 RepID=A0A6D2JP62_9BRAS|nr:unnamed protein product [Microthlaspi erraticum]